MFNLGNVLRHPMFAQAFTVYRSAGHFGPGGWIEDDPAVISMTGTVHPTTARELQQIPEGDRVTGSMTFYSAEPLYLTRTGETPGTSDQIEWRGERYRLIHIFPWQDYGYYAGIGVRMAGD